MSSTKVYKVLRRFEGEWCSYCPPMGCVQTYKTDGGLNTPLIPGSLMFVFIHLDDVVEFLKDGPLDRIAVFEGEAFKVTPITHAIDIFLDAFQAEKFWSGYPDRAQQLSGRIFGTDNLRIFRRIAMPTSTTI